MALPSFSEMLQGYESIGGPGQTIQAGVEGFGKGVQLADVLSQRKLREAQAKMLEGKGAPVNLYDALVVAGVPKDTIAASGINPDTTTSADYAKAIVATLSKKATAEAGISSKEKMATESEKGKTTRTKAIVEGATGRAETAASAKEEATKVGAATKLAGTKESFLNKVFTHLKGKQTPAEIGQGALLRKVQAPAVPKAAPAPTATPGGALRDQAIEILQDNGKVVNDETIAKVIQQLQ